MESPAIENGCILILYTTLYRKGGAKFARVASRLEADKRAEFPGTRVISAAVESKKDFVQQLERVAARNERIIELHFIGHSGLYGIMFGTTAWPEQFSPYEWTQLRIPFAPSAQAFFHACRTGRWFAPFFARTFQVRTHGYFWYTTVSTKKSRFAWEGFRSHGKEIYIVSVPGKKSHGLLSSARKYFFKPAVFPLLTFEPTQEKIDTTYDSVAELYDDTFEDISVRSDELRWLRRQLSETKPKDLLDIGCGTGSFLRGIDDLVENAHGVDLSIGMIEQARKRSAGSKAKLAFTQVHGPKLPFAENSFDVVTSVLSFRYLDWDPIISEILRVLRPGGRLLVIDMVAVPLSFSKLPRFLIDKFRQQWTLFRNPRYRQALRRMVTNKNWQHMLKYNPMRSEHEMKWYLQSRFPGCSLIVINYAYNSRIIAFASPPVFQKVVAPQSYP